MMDHEISSDQAGPLPVIRTRHITTRLSLSVPGAIGGMLLIGALAFGANLGLTSGTSRDEGAAPPAGAAVVPDGHEVAETTDEPKPTADEVGVEATDKPSAEPTDKPEPRPTDKPSAEPTDKPSAEPTDKPSAEPTDKPSAEPTERPVLALELDRVEGGIVAEWSDCKVDGADLYKVVRSTDSTVRWPAGENDTVVAVVEVGGKSRTWDGGGEAGTKVWYRVFCLRSSENGYRIVAASVARSIVAPEPESKPTPEPIPDPIVLGLELDLDGGAVVLHWESFQKDFFSHYRILRGTDGDAALLAEIVDAGNTTFVDDSVEVGGAYQYAVQAKGHTGDQWVLLGSSAWVGITVE